MWQPLSRKNWLVLKLMKRAKISQFWRWMNFLHTVKKIGFAALRRPKNIHMAWQVDRDRNQVIDFFVTESRGFLAYQPMAKRLEKFYNINYLCTDDYAVYKQIVIAKNHTTTKAETSLVDWLRRPTGQKIH